MVGDIENPTVQLWDTLMAEEDPLQRWTTQNYVQEETSNCTIAALSSAIGDTKCRNDCKSMGASSYRSFNDGCCHCVGHGCLNYGTSTAVCGFSADLPDLEDLSETDLLELETEYESIRSTNTIVNDISQGSATLWNALTEGEEMHQPWKTLTYPVDIPVTEPVSIQETVQDGIRTVNCTVAFWQESMSDMKCEKSCGSMGAASYRWFKDGCCECVGHACINYGLNEARCGFSLENAVTEADDLDYETLTDQEIDYLYEDLEDPENTDNEENTEDTESSIEK